MLHLLIVVLAVFAFGCFVFWVVGRLRTESARVDDILYPGSAAHRAALASVEEGTAPNLTVWRGMSTDQQETYDTAVLDRAERAELDARADAEEAAQVFLDTTARTNALYHP